METEGVQDAPLGKKCVLFFRKELFERVIQSFNPVWQDEMSRINVLVMKSIANFKNGTIVLHAALKQIVLSYQKFYQLFEKRFGKKGGHFKEAPVSLQAVMMELKKYKSAF